jgi:hypothetical protein
MLRTLIQILYIHLLLCLWALPAFFLLVPAIGYYDEEMNIPINDFFILSPYRVLTMIIHELTITFFSAVSLVIWFYSKYSFYKKEQKFTSLALDILLLASFKMIVAKICSCFFTIEGERTSFVYNLDNAIWYSSFTAFYQMRYIVNLAPFCSRK